MPLRTLFRLLLVLFVPTMAGMLVIDEGLKTPGNPGGIAQFEFCGITGTCAATVAEWGERGRELAMLSLGLDYLFLVLYAGLIATALLQLVPRLPAPQAATARNAARLALVAGVMDALENMALVLVVQGNGAAPPWAAGFASAKFLLLLWTVGCLLYFSLAARRTSI